MSKSPSAANKALDTITATGPGLPVVATPSALLMMWGSVASASARTVHLVMGWNNTCWSIYVLPGRHMPATLASAVGAAMAVEAFNASYMPRARCAAPGLEGRHISGLALILIYAVANLTAHF